MVSKPPSDLLFLCLAFILSIFYVYGGPFSFKKSTKLMYGTSLSSANAAPQQIVDFWAKWAQVIQVAKSKIDPIEIVRNAKARTGRKTDGKRKPTP